jgi:hypothetical protein
MLLDDKATVIYPNSGYGGVFQYHRDFVTAVLEFLES